jgi:hypothetical protein
VKIHGVREPSHHVRVRVVDELNSRTERQFAGLLPVSWQGLHFFAAALGSRVLLREL